MIHCEFEDKLEIKASLGFAQVLAEFEEIAREVRKNACEMFGEKDGMELYNFALEMAALREEKRKKYTDEEKADWLLQVIFYNASGKGKA